MREEIFNLIPGTVNTIRGTAVSHNTTMASAPRVSQTSFANMLAEEANLTSSCQAKHVKFRDMMRGVLPHPYPKNIKKRWSYIQTNRKKPPRGYQIGCGCPRISKDVETQDQQVKGWIFLISQIYFPILAERHRCPCGG